MIQRSPSIALSLFCACLAIQGCTSVKKTLGIERDPPNEYAVTPSTVPLEMPPFFYERPTGEVDLPPPVPGMERPQDKAARLAQEQKFLGMTQQEQGVSSQGQQDLLEMAEAPGNQEKIRSEIDTADRLRVDKNRPIVETLGLKEPKLEDALNPYEEKQRLEEQQLSSNTDVARQVAPPLMQKHARQRQKEGIGKGLSPFTPDAVHPIEPSENPGVSDY